MDSDARHIKYVALCCGGKILANHTHWDKGARENYGETLRQIFSSSGWGNIRSQKKSKLELKSAGNVYCMELDLEGRVYCVVVTAAYPVRHIFSSSAASSAAGASKLMVEFRQYVQETLASESLTAPEGGLQKTMRGFFNRLAVKFDDLEAIDSMAKVQGKLSAVRTLMSKNLSLADERHSLLERTSEKTAQLESSARGFYNKTSAIKSRACCAYYRIWIMVALALAISIAVCVPS